MKRQDIEWEKLFLIIDPTNDVNLGYIRTLKTQQNNPILKLDKRFQKTLYQRIYMQMPNKHMKKSLVSLVIRAVFSTDCSFAPSIPQKHLATSGDIFDCHDQGGGYYWHVVTEARDAAKLPTMRRTVPHPPKLFGLKCQ